MNSFSSSNIRCVPQPTVSCLFFHASLLPSGSTNTWPLQTGSMRVRGQTSVVFYPHVLLHHFSPTFPSTELSSHQLQSVLPWTPIPLHGTPPSRLSPPLHLSCCSIWCCLSSCHYLCPMCSYHLAGVTSICEAGLVSALFRMLPHASPTLFVWCQYHAGHSWWCLCDCNHWCYLQ